MANKTLTQTLNKGTRVDVNKKALSPGSAQRHKHYLCHRACPRAVGDLPGSIPFMIFTSLKTQGQISQLGAPSGRPNRTAYEYQW